jgi:hypothetical protein
VAVNRGHWFRRVGDSNLQVVERLGEIVARESR